MQDLPIAFWIGWCAAPHLRDEGHPHSPHALARQGELLDIARTEFIGRI